MAEYKLEKYEMLITSLRRISRNKLEKYQSHECIESKKQKGRSETWDKNGIESCFQNTSIRYS